MYGLRDAMREKTGVQPAAPRFFVPVPQACLSSRGDFTIVSGLEGKNRSGNEAGNKKAAGRPWEKASRRSNPTENTKILTSFLFPAGRVVRVFVTKSRYAASSRGHVRAARAQHSGKKRG
jgi:hypothetical protein